MASEPRGCLGALVGLFGGTATTSGARDVRKPTFPYTRSDRFLSPAEASFLVALRAAASETYDIFAKVRLIDLLSVNKEAGFQAAFNRVVSKQVDFLLCERGTSRIVLAIELDDSTHRQSARAARDAFVEEVLEVIGLPVLRVRVTGSYDPREISRLISATLSEGSAKKG